MILLRCFAASVRLDPTLPHDHCRFRMLCKPCAAYVVHRIWHILSIREFQASSEKSAFCFFFVLIPYFLGQPFIAPRSSDSRKNSTLYYISYPAVDPVSPVSDQLLSCIRMVLYLSQCRSFGKYLHNHHCTAMCHPYSE